MIELKKKKEKEDEKDNLEGLFAEARGSEKKKKKKRRRRKVRTKAGGYCLNLFVGKDVGVDKCSERSF